MQKRFGSRLVFLGASPGSHRIHFLYRDGYDGLSGGSGDAQNQDRRRGPFPSEAFRARSWASNILSSASSRLLSSIERFLFLLTTSTAFCIF